MKSLVTVLLLATCVNGFSQECAPETKFAPVPQQVVEYGASFRDNMLEGDKIVRTADANACKAAAVQSDYPSFFFDSTVTGPSENCFLTHVMVNCDYSFVDPALMTSDAKDKIHQRRCQYPESHKLPNYALTASIDYSKKDFGSCFGDGINDQRRKMATDSVQQSVQSDITRQSDTCQKLGVKVTVKDVTVTGKQSPNTGSDPPTFTIDMNVRVELQLEAQAPFLEFSDIVKCADSLTLETPSVVIGNDCSGSGKVVRYAPTDADGGWKRTHKKQCEPNWIFGPNDCMCYNTHMKGFETKKGYCPAPPSPPFVRESLFACSLRCLLHAECLGYNYDIKERTCLHHTHMCTASEIIVDDRHLLIIKSGQ